MNTPEISVIVPVYNEEQVLPKLFERLYGALDAMGQTYEVVFVNDGSRDRSAELLAQQFHRRPDVTRVVLFTGNFGQHMAILAGFERTRGERVVTLDADLQNPPEEIGKLLSKTGTGIHVNSSNGVTTSSATYSANFEKGKAIIDVNFRKIDGVWKLNGIHVKADAPQAPANAPSASPEGRGGT